MSALVSAPLHRAIDGISQRMRTRTPRNLEDDGLVSRTVHPTNPPSVEYGLTSLGVTLREPLDAMAAWAVAHAGDVAASRDRARRAAVGGVPT
ncbi:winged helix-turn-helix transcriptional regulator [Beutenbergia cavernae]|uniref:winged helix-turn-helix transcriptional regulator n=1 Tax=Beutenbergia cavernae TaxID=84757 RepID=UPI00019ACF4B|nr:helix-turn-helix domain-containing protein [Beutenbergia cavernae]